MDRRQNNGRRCQIVQEFVKGITDNTERLVCFLFMNNYADREVCKFLKINENTLVLLKMKLAFDMKKAGIRAGA